MNIIEDYLSKNIVDEDKLDFLEEIIPKFENKNVFITGRSINVIKEISIICNNTMHCFCLSSIKMNSSGYFIKFEKGNRMINFNEFLKGGLFEGQKSFLFEKQNFFDEFMKCFNSKEWYLFSHVDDFYDLVLYPKKKGVLMYSFRFSKNNNLKIRDIEITDDMHDLVKRYYTNIMRRDLSRKDIIETFYYFINHFNGKN